VLTALIGTEAGLLKPEQIHNEAVKMVQMPEGELFEFLARSLPYGTIGLLNDVRTETLLLLPPPIESSCRHLACESTATCGQACDGSVKAGRLENFL